MCGIAAYIPKDTGCDVLHARHSVCALFHQIADRGEDSVGMAIIRSNGKHSLYRSLGNVYQMFSATSFKRAMVSIGSNVTAILMHTRFATCGDVTVANTHPFITDNLALVHNGWINNYHSLEGFNLCNGETDSESLAHSIDMASVEYGNVAGAANALSTADGAAALLWVNRLSPDMVYMYRSGNPLTIKRNNAGPAILIASTGFSETLNSERIATIRNGIIQYVGAVAPMYQRPVNLPIHGKKGKKNRKGKRTYYAGTCEACGEYSTNAGTFAGSIICLECMRETGLNY